MKSTPTSRSRSARAGVLATSILLACGLAHAEDIAATGTQAAADDQWNLATWDGGGWGAVPAVPSAGNTYSTDAFQIRSSASTFGGDSLRVVTDGSLLLRQGNNGIATVGTLFLDGGTLIAGANVSTGTQVISGNLDVVSASIIELSGGTTRRISLTTGGLSGSGKITVQGGDSSNDYFFVNTTSASSHTGNWEINGGRLVVISDDQIGSSASVTLGSATLAFLDLRSSLQTIGSLSGNGTVQANSTTPRVLATGGDGTTTTFDGVIVDSNIALTKEGGGTFTLTGANTYGGSTTITGGTLTLGASGVIPDASPVSLGTATLNAATTGTESAGTLDVTGTATINLGTGAQLAFTSGTATWAGSLNITGAFVSGSSLNFGSSSGLTLTQLGQITLNGALTTFTLNGSGFLMGGVSGYATWQSNNTTSQTADLDHDNDGVSNGVEHFLFGTANSTGNSNPLPGITNTAGTLSVTWTKAGTYTGTYGTDFVVETSATLSNPWTTEIADPNPGFTVTFPTANEVKYTFPAGTKNFARLKVVTTP